MGAALLAKVRKPEEVQLRAWLLQFLKAEVTRQADVTRILPLINELEALPGQGLYRPLAAVPATER
ncbi:mobC protein [Salmonella enterica subsp. enterica serovar Typhimurium]|nr:mobC protein [Salmonella enterica subsp. enterica serovar Typhimurium]